MKTRWFALLAALLCLTLSTANAQAPAGAPAGTTATCNDGTYSSAASKRGACSGHKGVQNWFGSSSAVSPSAPAPSAAPSKPAPTTPAAPTQKAQASGGGAGQVWVNTNSNVYHCQGDRNYGTTKAGQYMSEADAKAKGARPAYGKTCTR